jgi:hypothetical protein
MRQLRTFTPSVTMNNYTAGRPSDWAVAGTAESDQRHAELLITARIPAFGAGWWSACTCAQSAVNEHSVCRAAASDVLVSDTWWSEGTSAGISSGCGGDLDPAVTEGQVGRLAPAGIERDGLVRSLRSRREVELNPAGRVIEPEVAG